MSEFFRDNKALVASMAAGAAGLGLWYWFQNRQVSDFNKPYPREVVIAALKEFKREFGKLYMVLYQQVARLKQMIRAQGKEITPSMSGELKMMLVDQNPEFAEQVQEIEERTYSKHKIDNRQRFQKSCEITYKNDPEIRVLLRDMHESLENVLRGMPPTNNTTIPDALTADVTLKIITGAADDFSKNLINLAEEYLQRGEQVNKDNRSFFRDLQQSSPEVFKTKYIVEYGIDKATTDPDGALSKAIEKYLSMNSDGFREKLAEAETRNKQLLQLIFSGGLTLDQIRKFREDSIRPAAIGRIREAAAIEEVEEPAHESRHESRVESHVAALKEELEHAAPEHILNPDAHVDPAESVVISGHKTDSTEAHTTGDSHHIPEQDDVHVQGDQETGEEVKLESEVEQTEA